ncbi:MAG: hypothetical protein R2910_02560 [Gemmatimonadales bacterium]
MKLSLIVVTSVILATMPAAVAAQEKAQIYTSSHWVTWEPPSFESTAALVSAAADDYRWTGAIVGGVLLGAAGGVLLGGMCSENGDDNCGVTAAFGVLLGAAVGVPLGGLIGSLFPKGD